MNWWRWVQIFEDDKGRLSTTNIAFMICVLSMLFVVLYSTLTDGADIEIYWAWIGLCTMGLVTKKGFDAINRGSDNGNSNQ